MILIMLESGNKINNIGDELKTIRFILTNTIKVVKQFVFIFRYEQIFWILKAYLKHEKTVS
jgi:hypothetical protein